MLDHLNEFLVDLDIVCSHVLTVLQRNLDAELIKFSLLILIELPMLECCIILLKIFKQTVSHFYF